MPGIERLIHADLHHTEEVIRRELAEVGFGVLTEIDVAGVLKSKLDVDRPPVKVLGACNPQLVHQALEVDAEVLLAIPCNVVLDEHPDGTLVTIADPRVMMPGDDMAELAAEAADKLTHALDMTVVHTTPGA